MLLFRRETKCENLGSKKFNLCRGEDDLDDCAIIGAGVEVIGNFV